MGRQCACGPWLHRPRDPITALALCWMTRPEIPRSLKDAPAPLPAAAGGLSSWRAIDAESASPWRRSTMVLRELWHAFTRELPERRYERRILERMARGELIETLGTRVRNEARTRRRSERWLAALIEVGLRPDHLCVE